MNKSTITMALAATLLSVSAGQASEFAGGWVGAKAGVNRSDVTVAGVAQGSGNAGTYGFEGGYNWDVNNILLGVDGFADYNQKVNHTNAAGTNNFGSDVLGLDVKAGLPKGKWLPYAKLGYGSNKWTGSGTGTASGAHIGLGVEYKIAPHISLAGEFTSMEGKSTGLKSTNNNFTLAVNYYFDSPRVATVAVAKPAAPAVKKVRKIGAATPAVDAAVAAPAEVKVTPKEVVWKTLLEEKPVTYSGVNFDTRSAKLTPAADKTLDDVSEFAKRYPDAQLTISGHTDFRAATSKKDYNMKLSMRRANSFKEALVKRGVDAKRITTEGFGFDQPIADNNTDAGRAQNRRVVVRSVIKEEKKVPVTE